MTVLITRAAREAELLAQTLEARSIATMIEPLMAIRRLPHNAEAIEPFLEGVQAALFTSANGARAFAAATPRRDLPVFAVGDTTAAAARDAGFAAVTSAGGNVEDLAGLVIATLKPAEGALVHAAGSVTAGDLPGLLGAAGFTLRRAVLYEVVPSDELTAATRAAMERGEIAAVVFFSPRNAATFVRLAGGLRGPVGSMIAVALSEAVAGVLDELPWRRIIVAASPTEAALVEALEHSLAMERLP